MVFDFNTVAGGHGFGLFNNDNGTIGSLEAGHNTFICSKLLDNKNGHVGTARADSNIVDDSKCAPATTPHVVGPSAPRSQQAPAQKTSPLPG